MALKWHELSTGREYIISHDKKIHEKPFYKGTFIERHESRGSRLISIEKRTIGNFGIGHFGGFGQYETVIMWLSLFSINGDNKYFFEYDTYYDVEQIKKNATQARKNMEQRALDKILKRIVNEEFQW
jgi:hypothetical protein